MDQMLLPILLFAGLGAFTGGLIATFLQGHSMPVVMGVQLHPLHVLFLISAALRVSSLLTMRLVHEPRGAILREARVISVAEEAQEAET